MNEPFIDRYLLDLCRQGDEEAARQLFDRYVDRLVSLARRHMSQRLGSRVDPEDVVQSVFRTFFQRAQEGQFVVAEQDDLCKLLVRITVRKTLQQAAFHRAAKRDFEAEAGAGIDRHAKLQELLEREPTPDEAVAFLDQLEHFLLRLKAQEREILEMRSQGYTVDEIASRLGTYDRKIRRVIERIRGLAEKEGWAGEPT
jgi:RNA polymerase sigma-70 factor (ECF subfamily)